MAIGSGQALGLTLALHELATNAVKYGALSDGTGKVSVSWVIDADRGEFRFVWSERDGPPVTPPEQHGFGSRIVDRALAEYFNGSSTLAFEPAGLRFELSAPVSGLGG